MNPDQPNELNFFQPDDVPPNVMQFIDSDGRTALKIDLKSGTIDLCGREPDEAARTFLDAVRRQMGLKVTSAAELDDLRRWKREQCATLDALEIAVKALDDLMMTGKTFGDATKAGEALARINQRLAGPQLPTAGNTVP
jgi:hypothetical protein